MIKLKDKEKKISTALRAAGFNLDDGACEIMLGVIDLVRQNMNASQDSTIEEIIKIKSDITETIQRELAPQG